MMFNPRLVLILFIASSLFFSGCLGFQGGDDPEPAEGQSDRDDGTESLPDEVGDEGVDGEDPQDEKAPEEDNQTVEPPTASLTANVTDGTAPLAVLFSLDATYADPDALEWTLELGQDGETQDGVGLPANVTYTFETTGNHTVILTVVAGDASSQANVTITVEPGYELGEVQTGAETDCVDFNVFWLVEGEDFPLAEAITVQAGTGFQISADAGDPFVDFYADDGTWVGWSAGETEGTVPDGASYGIVCVSAQELSIPEVGVFQAPDPTAEWTYQDGFPAA